jgi:hypothetical protein
MRIVFVAVVVVAVWAVGCPSTTPTDTGVIAGEGEDTNEGEGDVDTSQALELAARLHGLWAGFADSQTSLGDFVRMSMDHRSDGGVLFARGDLDANNAIRWWLWQDEEGTLRFENGGLFAGFSRTDGCRVVSSSDNVLRFCADEGGCDHIDAQFAFSSNTEMVLSVVVDGSPHVTWQATRIEERDTAAWSQSNGQAPNLPTVQVNATFAAVAADAAAWVILTTTRCGIDFSCNVSRSFRQPLMNGDTSTSFQIREIHPGDYFAVLVVDRNNNFAQSPFPDAADRISVPNQAVRVDPVDGAVLNLQAMIAPP